MKNRLWRWLLVSLLLLPVQAMAAQPRAMEIGVFPNLSPKVIMTLYQPLRSFLEVELKRPVNIYSASDFRTFAQQTRAGGYDLLITAPHLARLAQNDDGYLPLFNYTRSLRAMIVVHKDSPITTLEGLRGQAVAIPDFLAVIPMMGVHLLREAGLKTEKDVTLEEAHTHNNAALQVQRRQAQGAIIGSAPYNQLPEDLKKDLRILAETSPIPNQFLLAGPRIKGAEAEKLKAALERFAASPEGAAFLKTNGFDGIRPAREADLKRMDPYVTELRKRLAQ
jgi:phosphonate transport system substrate-binding protein